MQSDNRLFDDFVKIVNGAAGTFADGSARLALRFSGGAPTPAPRPSACRC